MLAILLILLSLAVLLEGSITTLPLTLVCLLCLTIIKRDDKVFIAAFIAGLFLDIFALRQVGGTSIFFLLFVFLLLLYQRKYEIYSTPFVLVATFMGSALFLFTFGYGNVLGQAVLSTLIAGVLFSFIRLLGNGLVQKQETRSKNYGKH
jgi:cell shape-determining protein MreD